LAGVSPRVAAEFADGLFRQMKTLAAISNIFADIHNRLSESQGFRLVDPQQMVGNPLSRTSPNAGQSRQLFNQFNNGLRQLGHLCLPVLKCKFADGLLSCRAFPDFPAFR
jgi:hypothetical protein